jgi:hypothetical protein
MFNKSTYFSLKLRMVLSALILVIGGNPLDLKAQSSKKSIDITAVNSNDTANLSWLPGSENQTVSISKSVDQFLHALNGKIRILDCEYDGAKLKNALSIGNDKITDSQSNWSCELQSESVPDNKEAMDLSFTFILRKGNLKSSGTAVAFDFTNWNIGNYILAPAAVYNANRYRILPVQYPPYIYDSKDKPLDMPVTITNVLHLNRDESPGKIEMLTGSCSTPLLSFYNPEEKRGWIMLATQTTPLGNSGLIIQEDLSRKRATFVLSAPGVREYRYVMTGFTKSTDQPAEFKANDALKLKMRIYNFAANDLQAFYDRVFTIRKDLSGPTVYRNVAPFSAINEIILDHHDKTKFYEDNKYAYICSEPKGDQPYWHLQAGWGGVPAFSFPQVIQPTPERLNRITKSFDVLKIMQGKTGLTHGIFMKGEFFGDNFNEKEKNRHIAMVRRNGEMLFFGIQSLELLKMQGKASAIKPEWEEMFRKQADGIVQIWKDYGQFGQFIDVETGKMDVNGSTAGAVCITGLALAAEYFSNPGYLKIAEEAGRYYYNRDLVKGYAGGGPAEILQGQDSEAAYDITEAYTTLFEKTGNKEWLKYARDAAALFSTWTVSYDYKFPIGSVMHRIDARSTGAVWASIQNAHGAPGMYILSGNFLLRLYRATGDKRYMELLKDIAHNVVQYTTTEKNPVVPKAVPGSVSERVNLSDWEGAENIGGSIPDGDSNMAWGIVTSLTITQNPGIYLRFDTGELFVLDNVEATITKRDTKNITLRITNPTPYDGKISLFSEDSAMAGVVMDRYAYMKWPKVEVKSGETIEITINSDGQIIQMPKI